MPEEQVDVVEEEILDGKGGDGLEDSSPPEQDSQEKAGEAGKTTEEVGSTETPEPDDLAGLKEGQSIPFERFKQVIDKRNKLKNDYEGLTAELTEARGFINNPDVYRAILLTKGITDKKVQNEKLKEAGFEVKEETPQSDVYKQITTGLDLNTQEGWLKAMERAVRTYGKELVEPIQKKLSEKDVNEMLLSQAPDAKKTAEKFGLEYGDEKKDGKDITKGVGILNAFITQNPKMQQSILSGVLTKSQALVLALENKGHQLGKQEGLNEAKLHNENLKNSQMEDESGQVREGMPDSGWSSEDLMRYHRKHFK